MKVDWQRPRAQVQVSSEQMQELLAPVCREKVESIEYLEGGLANTNIKVTAGKTYVVRLIERDLASMEKERRLNHLLGATVPMPRFLHTDQDSCLDLPYIIMDYAQGERLDKIGALNPAEAEALGKSLGRTLYQIHRIKFTHHGFLSEKLTVDTPFDLGARGITDFAERVLIEDGGAKKLGAGLSKRLLAFLEMEGQTIECKGHPTLCHGDFGGANILVARNIDALPAVSAVLDFEFAVSGTAFVDLGNLLRPPLGEIEGLAAAVKAGYEEGGEKLPANWLEVARMSDLFAWLDFVSRDNVTEEILETARVAISDTICSYF